MSKKFVVELELENAAFEELEYELARILRVIAEKVEGGKFSGYAWDTNGNTVGNFQIKDE